MRSQLDDANKIFNVNFLFRVAQTVDKFNSSLFICMSYLSSNVRFGAEQMQMSARVLQHICRQLSHAGQSIGSLELSPS